MYSYDAIYGDNTIIKNIFGRIGMTILSLGLFLPFMIGEYIYWMCINLTEPPYSSKYKIGVLQLSIITLGLYAVYHFTKSRNIFVRYIAKAVIILMNTALYGLIYYFVLSKYYKYAEYILIPLCLVNYPVYVVSKYLIYSEGVRSICSVIWKGCVHSWWFARHSCDYMKYLISYMLVKMRNGISSMKTKTKNILHRTYVRFHNITLPRIIGNNIIQEGDLNYVQHIIYQPNVYQYPVIRTLEQKIFDRLQSEKAIKEQQLSMTIYCIKCVIGYSNCMFQDKIENNPTTKDKFWSKRYERITNNVQVYNGTDMLNLRNYLFDDKYFLSSSINLNLNKSEYDNSTHEFDKYICHLNKLKNAEYERNYECLNNSLGETV
jgi:hypothetical protein